MNLEFIGVDPDTPENGSPTLWIDRDTNEIVLQGWIANEETRAECLTFGPIPDHETVMRWPFRMMPFLEEIVDEYRRQRAAGTGEA